MDKYGKNTPVDVPKWDIALEALVNDEHRRLRRPLGLDDLRRLGQTHQIRFHDIMATMYQLEKHGKWAHQGRDDGDRATGGSDLDALYDHGRLDEDLAERFSVTWAPR